MSKPEARSILNAARDGKPIPVWQIRLALYSLGDYTYPRATK